MTWQPRVGAVLLSHSFAPTVREHTKLVEDLAAAGYAEMQFPVGGMTESDLDGFRDLCQRKHLAVSAIGAFIEQGPDAACPISTDQVKRARALIQMELMMRNAKSIGAYTLVGPFLQGLMNPKRTFLTEQQREWRMEFVMRVDRWAQELGVDVGIEGVNRFETFAAPNDAEAVVGVLDAIGTSNRLGVLIDTFHQTMRRRNTPIVWEAVTPRIKMIHFSDMDRTDLGNGPVFPDSLFEVLKSTVRPSCGICVELWGSDFPPGIEGPLALANPSPKDGLTLFREAIGFVQRRFSLV